MPLPGAIEAGAGPCPAFRRRTHAGCSGRCPSRDRSAPAAFMYNATRWTTTPAECAVQPPSRRRMFMNRGPGTLRTVMIVLGSSWFGFVLNLLRVLVLPAKLGDLGLGDVTTAVSFTTFFGIFISLGT